MNGDALLLIGQLVNLQPGPDYADTLRAVRNWTSSELARLARRQMEAPHAPCVARSEDIVHDPCHPAMPYYPWGPLERSET